MPSFDIVSEADIQEVRNAIDQANREIGTRFDFKGVTAKYEYKDDNILVSSESDFQVKQMIDILQNKFIKRGLEPGSMEVGDMETNLSEARVNIKVLQGIDKELTRKTKENWYDLFVGARWMAPINENWSYMLRGDIGGLGLEADFTAGLTAGVQYHINNTMTIDAQYKATWVDYATGTAGEQGSFAYDTVTHGPILGFIYRF